MFRFDPAPLWAGLRAALLLLAAGPLAAAILDEPAWAGLAGAAVLAGLAWAMAVTAVGTGRLARAGASGPVETANVVGTLGAGAWARRRLVLVAHHDTKSQPLPLPWRAALVVVLGLAWLGVPVEMFWDPPARGVLPLVPLDLWLGAGAVAGGMLAWGAGNWGNRSPGALDNGASVVALREAARRLGKEAPGDVELVVAFTGAEEHMMLGARKLADDLLARPGGAERTLVVNLDGVGEPGPVGIEGPEHLRDWVRGAAASSGVPIRSVHVPPGTATDAMPLRAMGFEVVQLTSGRFGPGARSVHTAGDTARHVEAETLARVADLLVALVRTECGESGRAA